MTILGPLVDEPPEPLTKEKFEAVRKRLKATLNGVVTTDERDLERVVVEVIWLKKRLRRVEYVLAPLIE